MKEFIEYLLRQIVSDPESVKIEESIQGTNINLTITVAPNDMGLVIGKEGRVIKSLRAMAKAKAIKDGIRVNVELNDPYSKNAYL